MINVGLFIAKSAEVSGAQDSYKSEVLKLFIE